MAKVILTGGDILEVEDQRDGKAGGHRVVKSTYDFVSPERSACYLERLQTGEPWMRFYPLKDGQPVLDGGCSRMPLSKRSILRISRS